MDYYSKYIKYKSKYIQLKSKYEMNGGGSGKELVLFRAEWCPHCRNFVSDWNDLQKTYNDINFVTVDDSDRELVEFYNNKELEAKAFPTLFLGKDNEYFEYMGPMKKESIEKFLNSF